jgi:hypothetical protein
MNNFQVLEFETYLFTSLTTAPIFPFVFWHMELTVPQSVLFIQSIDKSHPCFETVISIANEEYATLQINKVLTIVELNLECFILPI